MENEKIKAVLFGATGIAGSGVLDECLKHPMVKKVTIITRTETGIKHDKLTEIVHSNYLDYSNIKQQLEGHNTCFYCLGISQSQEKDEQKYREITLAYTLAAAKILAEVNKDFTFCFLSGMGTDPTLKSRQMWARVKGQAEKSLEDFAFRKLYVFRPGYIHPVDGKRHRLFFIRIISPFYPILNKLFPGYVTTTEEFGLAMLNAVLNESEKQVFENKDIRELGTKKSDI
jgi:uncharacterized protein YbjT (DUF2867 family)